MKRLFGIVIWLGIALLGAGAFAKIAFDRGEPLNATWFVVAAVCCYLVAYRLYSAFVAAKVLALDDTRATPSERHDDGRDFVPTNKWVLFGHHFAAIAGPGPLVGPTLAAQFGYLPGTLWLIAGAAFAGCVQDFVILFCSIRREGKSLGQMAREGVGDRGGFIAGLAVLAIMTVLLAVIGLVVVNALKSSPWATFTLAMTIPSALLLGLYLRFVRPGRVLEASVMGVALILFVVFAGQWVADSPSWSRVFTLSGVALAFAIIAYAFRASALPVWLLLAPRDYLTAFISPPSMVGVPGNAAAATISGWGYPLQAQTMTDLAHKVGEITLWNRAGGAPSLAVGMAQIFSSTIGGERLLSIWYHFAIMFEALFILTVLDAGTRVGRFMVQDLGGRGWKPFG